MQYIKFPVIVYIISSVDQLLTMWLLMYLDGCYLH